MHAIGEIGFDLWPEFRHTLALQRSIFVEELRLAQQYHLPIVVHQRRAMHEIFAQISSLKRLPAVIFHGYSGTFLEALSLRKRGVHAYFSVGTPLLWGVR